MSKQPFNKTEQPQGHRHRRSGTTVVETAFVMPFFIFFLYMVLEVSHMIVVNSAVNNAARAAARFGTTSVASSSDTMDRAASYCTAVVPDDIIRVWVKDASGFDDGTDDISDPLVRDGLADLELLTADSNTLFMVQVKVAFDDIAFIPWPFTQNVEFEGRAFMRRE